MTTFAAALARTTEHPSDYVIFVVLGMAVVVFGV